MNARITASTLLLALAFGLAPASADNVKIKYILQCGAAKSVPPDDDADPIFQTRIVATTDGEIYVRHFAASGARYDRNSQYRGLKFWSENNADNWSGVSIKHPDRTMVGRLSMGNVEKHYRGGQLESITTNICRFTEPGPEGEKS